MVRRWLHSCCCSRRACATRAMPVRVGMVADSAWGPRDDAAGAGGERPATARGRRARRDGTGVGRGVIALVAIGDGADAEHVRGGTCSLSRGIELRRDVGGRMHGRIIAISIAVVIVIAQRGSARWIERLCIDERTMIARTAVERANGDGAHAPSRTRRAKCRGMGSDRSAREWRPRKARRRRHRARTRVAGTDSGSWVHRTAQMRPVVNHAESGRCREAPAAWLRRAPLTRPSSASPVCRAAELCRRGCR